MRWSIFIPLMLIVGLFLIYIQNHPSHLNPCPYEDEDNCWWDATTMGNGIGDSFVVIKGNKIYLNR